MNAQTDDWLPRHRLTVDDYYRMGETGVLAPDARTELINGEIIDMTPPGSRHSATVAFLADILTAVTGSSAIRWVQSPLRLNHSSEPQPDLMLLKRRDDFYAEENPGPADVILLVELSDSSLRYDRQIKGPLYASHGIPEYWLVDLAAHELQIHRQPRNGAYVDVSVASGSQLQVVTTSAGWTVDLSRLFSL